MKLVEQLLDPVLAGDRFVVVEFERGRAAQAQRLLADPRAHDAVARFHRQWLELDKTGFKGTVRTQPAREDITMPIQEQLIVELYSK